MFSKVIFYVISINFILVRGHIQLPVPNEALDQNLYRDVIDPELCSEQIAQIRNNTLLSMSFADAGIRVPRGVLTGNTLDLGNYHQCLGINQITDTNTELQGKYCMIRVPMNQSYHFPEDFEIPNFDPRLLQLDDETVATLKAYYASRQGMLAMSGIFNDERVVFSIIGLLTLVSTTFDIWQTIILKKDPKTVSVIGRSFSVYTNGRRVMTFSSGANTIECLDGIRALAMMWVCVGQTWYLAIDVQLHILSPILLYWVLMGRKKIAWAALLAGLVAILTAATTYNFIREFPSTMMGRPERTMDYSVNYYMNTLTRGSPFLVGMIFGYLVRTEKLVMSKITTAFYWIAAFSLSTLLMYTNYPIAQPDWDNQLGDSLYNSFVRPLWALYLGCLIYACVNGYGGPINWFLSLSVWKLQSRLSYGMYLFHYGLMVAVNYTAVSPMYFSVESVLFKFLAHYALSFAVTFLMVLVIDAPFSTLIKLIFTSPKKPTKKEFDEEPTKEMDKTV
ncbi:unnamed protein product [Spodoptera littoralis]|uniref:Nose resistant-to-fluoxetine protein N-terminal domain-containing protein n=1 Tax=Spodoptera littoralis TaxID=7109 RepID=A0A9P0NB70_SPOLI|nr:unnamed protein product [Spodoptera littoralis]CAH1646497.1 unnamed protein product [Spodoptera littoralis]